MNLGADISKPIEIDINPDLKAMISESEDPQPVFQPKPVMTSQMAPPVSVNVRTYDPLEPPTQVQQVNRTPAIGAPTPNSTYQQQPLKPTSVENNNGVHDLRNPEKSGVLRLPTVNYKPQPILPAAPMGKSSALGNISSFMNKNPSQNTRPNTGKPEFLQSLIDKEFPLGEPAVLEVRVNGQAPIAIQWYHNSQPVRESVEKDIRLLQKGLSR